MTLLDKVKQILRESDIQRKASGEDFNIFFAANIWWKETTICRVLKEIIDVSGSNPVADTCLKLFCHEVLQLNISKEAIEKADIVLVLIDNSKQLDIEDQKSTKKKFRLKSSFMQRIKINSALIISSMQLIHRFII